MSVANGVPQNTRAFRDINYIQNTVGPNAANIVNTNGMNLAQATPYPVTERFIAAIVTTQSTGANSFNININWQHCADNGNAGPDSANWANIPELSTLVIAGNAANYPANTRNVQFPPSVKQWVRLQAKGEANGGNAADGTISAQLLF